MINFLASKSVNVVIHDSSSSIRFDLPNVKYLSFVEDLANEISQCDLIVLPYKKEEYTQKGSGILYQALASGIPVLVPFNTSLAAHVEETESGIAFFDHNPKSIIEAFLIAESRYKEISKNASITALKWSQMHGIKNFVKSFIEESNFSKC